MRGRELGAITVLVLAGACSSAAVPGAEGVLSKVNAADKAGIDVALHGAATAESTIQATNGSFTTDVGALTSTGMLQVPPQVTVTVARADASGYCIEAVHEGVDGTFHISNTDQSVADGSC